MITLTLYFKNGKVLRKTFSNADEEKAKTVYKIIKTKMESDKNQYLRITSNDVLIHINTQDLSGFCIYSEDATINFEDF